MFNLRETSEAQDLVTFRTSLSRPLAIRTPSHADDVQLRDLVNSQAKSHGKSHK